LSHELFLYGPNKQRKGKNEGKALKFMVEGGFDTPREKGDIRKFSLQPIIWIIFLDKTSIYYQPPQLMKKNSG